MVEGFEVRETSKPAHGTLEIVPAQGFSQWPKDNVRSKCNDKKLRGFNIIYKSNDGFHGLDGFDLTAFYPEGFIREIHVNVDVR